MSSILSELSLEEDVRQQKLLTSAQLEANRTYEDIIEDGKKRLNQRRNRLKQELATKKRQEMTRISMNAQQGINLFKQEKIEVQIECCKEHFRNLSEDKLLKILDASMKNVSEQDNPEILVPTKYYVAVANRYSKRFPVISDDKMEAGFIVTCDSFDINYDLEQVFAYKDQELRRALMHALFGESSNDSVSLGDSLSGE